MNIHRGDGGQEPSLNFNQPRFHTHEGCLKGITEGQAIILSAEGNFHGRTLGVISLSTEEESRKGFGPYLSRVGAETAAFLVEPIQGEAGVVVPPEDYLEKAQELCKQHNIQTGLGRTGKMCCYEHNPRVKPDIITLGKALSGGFYPISAVLTSHEVMGVIKPGEHGSTFGGNPLACAIGTAALDVIVDEKLTERAQRLGEVFRSALSTLKKDEKVGKWLTEVRGKGLLNAIVIDESKSTRGRGAWEVCLLMKERGVLAKPTHRNIIRLAPPLTIEEEDLLHAVQVIKESLEALDVVDNIDDPHASEKIGSMEA
ncbi:hypothetical protein BT69DRAFT_1313831 [Atractiella rhizophila]|nr:hypothetical protein BT69DRAFT_1313831 [Atractiella rhizophila]